MNASFKKKIFLNPEANILYLSAEHKETHVHALRQTQVQIHCLERKLTQELLPAPSHPENIQQGKLSPVPGSRKQQHLSHRLKNCHLLTPASKRLTSHHAFLEVLIGIGRRSPAGIPTSLRAPGRSRARQGSGWWHGGQGAFSHTFLEKLPLDPHTM